MGIKRFWRSGSFLVLDSIRVKLFLTYFFVVAISVLMLGLLSFKKSAEIIESKSSLYLQQLSNQILNNLDRDIYELDRVSFITYYNQYVQDALKDNKFLTYDEIVRNDNIIHETFLTVVLSKENIGDVYIVTADGELKFHFVKSYNNRQELNFSGDIRNQEWFKKVVDLNGKMALIGVNTVVGESKVTDTFLIARAIRSTPDGKLLGVVLIEENIKALEKIIGSIELGNGSMVFITDENGSLQFSNDSARTSEFYSQIIGNKDLEEQVFSGTGNNRRIAINGKPFLMVSSTSDYSKWKTITLIPIDEFIKDSNALKKISYFICLLSLAVCSLISVFFSYLIFKPIVGLRKAMKKVEGGDLTVEVNVNSNDEIGQLRKGFNSMVEKVNNLIQREYNSQILMKQAQLDSLQSRINPHFLYNILDSIRAEALVKDADEVADMIKMLGDIFQYSTSKGGNVVRVRDEIRNVENYITLQKFRFNDRLEVRYEIAEEVLDCSMLRLILQPIVENAIKHGIEPKLGPGVVTVSVDQAGEDILFVIADDGIGIKAGELMHINSELCKDRSGENAIIGQKIGIYNVNARLKNFYGEKYGLTLESEEGQGTSVFIRIPVIRQPI
jgi:Predicted signal transduction protein with a C-terminal ATPase domain